MKKPIEIGDNLAFVLIVLIIMLVCLLGGYLESKAQTVLPNWVADSLIYETFKGRQCSVVMQAQQNEIEKLGAELMHTNKALDLKQSETKTLENLLSNSKEQGRVDKMQADLNEKVLKQKVKKRNGIILIETIGIIGIILLL